LEFGALEKRLLHVRKTFEIAQCKVMSSARGYYRHE
jgi:hypothetical protein